jgi:hypothetical protein
VPRAEVAAEHLRSSREIKGEKLETADEPKGTVRLCPGHLVSKPAQFATTKEASVQGQRILSRSVFGSARTLTFSKATKEETAQVQ